MKRQRPFARNLRRTRPFLFLGLFGGELPTKSRILRTSCNMNKQAEALPVLFLHDVRNLGSLFEE
jgi:hypothetical protein